MTFFTLTMIIGDQNNVCFFLFVDQIKHTKKTDYNIAYVYRDNMGVA